MRGCNHQAFAVRRPIEFVNVHILWRNLPNARRIRVDQSEPLLEEFLGDNAFVRSLRHEWPGRACRVFGEKQRDRLPVGRPSWTGEEALQMSQLSCAAA